MTLKKNKPILVSKQSHQDHHRNGPKISLQRINEMKNWVFEMINNIDKFLAKLTISQREKNQINKIR